MVISRKLVVRPGIDWCALPSESLHTKYVQLNHRVQRTKADHDRS